LQRSGRILLKEGRVHEATPAVISQVPDPPLDASDLTVTYPFALKATSQNSLGPRHQIEEDPATADKEKCIGSKKAIEVNLVDPIGARKAMLDADPDLKVLQSQKALCNICHKVSSCYHPRYSPS
jgi:hypothetical protein